MTKEDTSKFRCSDYVEKKKANNGALRGEDIVTKIVEFPLAVDKMIKKTLGLATSQMESSSEQQ